MRRTTDENAVMDRHNRIVLGDGLGTTTLRERIQSNPQHCMSESSYDDQSLSEDDGGGCEPDVFLENGPPRRHHHHQQQHRPKEQDHCHAAEGIIQAKNHRRRQPYYYYSKWHPSLLSAWSKTLFRRTRDNRINVRLVTVYIVAGSLFVWVMVLCLGLFQWGSSSDMEEHNHASSSSLVWYNYIHNIPYMRESFLGSSSSDTTEPASPIPKTLIFLPQELSPNKDGPIQWDTTVEDSNAALWKLMYGRGTGYEFHMFSSTSSIESFIVAHEPAALQAFVYDCQNDSERLDLARLILLYHLGGAVIDLSVTTPLQRFSSLWSQIETNDPSHDSGTQQQHPLIAAIGYDFETLSVSQEWGYPRQRGLSSHCLLSVPHHPVVRKAMDQVLYNLMHRSQIEKEIQTYGYPPHLLQDEEMMQAIRRMWITGSKPLSEIIIPAAANHVVVVERDTTSSRGKGKTVQLEQEPQHENHKDAVNDDDMKEYTVVLLSRNVFMQYRPGDNRFLDVQTKIQRPPKCHGGGGSVLVFEKRKNSNVNVRNAEFELIRPEDGHDACDNRITDPHYRNNDRKIIGSHEGGFMDESSVLFYDESHLSRAKQQYPVVPVSFLVGMVRDASEIKADTFQYMMSVACDFHMNVHIIIGTGEEDIQSRHGDAMRQRRSKLVEGKRRKPKCGRFHILREPADLRTMKNRVDRISYLRDLQRKHMIDLLGNSNKDDAIIVVDFDLYALPPVSQLQFQIQEMRQKRHVDVLCAAGVMYRPFGYYDLFATVLADNTFLYPTRHRLLGKVAETENINLIRSDDEYGEVTSWDILDWFEKTGLETGSTQKKNATDAIHRISKHTKKGVEREKGSMELKSEVAPVEVKSCFGGLAIYFASKLLERKCQYRLPVDGVDYERLLGYANWDDRRPCEHVVLHDCLSRAQPQTKIAIQPDMRTNWNQAPTFPIKRLISESSEDALQISLHQQERGDVLLSDNEKFALKIVGNGELVIESCEHKYQKSLHCSKPNITWRSKDDAELVTGKNDDWSKQWTHMFLILDQDGSLTLLKQISKKLLPKWSRGCGRDNDNSCQLVVWSSESAQTKPWTCRKNRSPTCYQRFELRLSDKGELAIYRRLDLLSSPKTQHALPVWTSRES